MNLEWQPSNCEGWDLVVNEPGNVADGTLMGGIDRIGHRVYRIQWWDSPISTHQHESIFEGSLMQAKAYVIALVKFS